MGAAFLAVFPTAFLAVFPTTFRLRTAAAASFHGGRIWFSSVQQNQTHGYANQIKENNHFLRKGKRSRFDDGLFYFLFYTMPGMSSGLPAGSRTKYDGVGDWEKLMKLAVLISMCLVASRFLR